MFIGHSLYNWLLHVFVRENIVFLITEPLPSWCLYCLEFFLFLKKKSHLTHFKQIAWIYSRSGNWNLSFLCVFNSNFGFMHSSKFKNIEKILFSSLNIVVFGGKPVSTNSYTFKLKLCFNNPQYVWEEDRDYTNALDNWCFKN